LRGDGFVLRRLATADLAAFQAYRTDAALGRYQGWSPMTDAEARAFLEERRGVRRARVWRRPEPAMIAARPA
jgi:hypothetical protein